MKKVVTVMLVLVMCLSLCACGGDGDKGSFIIGIWEFDNGGTLEFKKDNTGVMKQGENEMQFTWKYDAELDCFPIARENGSSTFNATYKKDADGKITLTYGGAKGTKK